MKLKKFCLFIVLICVAIFGQALRASEKPVKDSVLETAYLASNPVSYYEGGGAMVAGEKTWYFQFRYVPNVGIVQMKVNGQSVVIPGVHQPVAGIPWPNKEFGSVNYVSLNVYGYTTESSGPVVTGWGTLHYPKPGDVLIIRIQGGYGQGFLPYDLPDGLDPFNTQIKVNSGGNYPYDYDPNQGGFVIWYDKTIVGQTYEIWSGGSLIERGNLDVVNQELESPSSDGFSFALVLPEGTNRVKADEYTRFNNLTLSGFTTMLGDGKIENGESAEIFWVSKSQYSSWISANFFQIWNMRISVFGVEDNGDVVLLESRHYQPDEGHLFLSLYCYDYDEIIIVVTETGKVPFTVEIGGGKG